MSIQNAKGSCLCGAIKVTVEEMSAHIGSCHCKMCRQWGGGPFLAADCGQKVSFEGEESLSVYSSSEWAERGFCKACGTHLFYRLKEKQQHIMPVGLFEKEDGFVFDHQIFIEEQPPYYKFANETKNMTGEEVFAQFASE